jgi:8-oxo-dGTP pyrophosphatase MutT (NUDIX family)
VRDAATRHDEILRERIRTHLGAFEREPHADAALRPAAVAVALVPGEDGTPCFVLTRRAARLRAHGGQWALPGGRIDAGESAETAALRELAEEVGLVAAPGDVLGRLDDYATRSGFLITPVVVFCDRGELQPNPNEVAAVYRVPLAELERPDVPRLREIPESERPVISIPLLGTFIHAPTAAVLFQLREVAVWGRATRVSHYEQPVFAWR